MLNNLTIDLTDKDLSEDFPKTGIYYEQLSSRMMDKSPVIKLGNNNLQNICGLIWFQTICDLIMELGDIEHSGDWDLGFIIEFKDNRDNYEMGPGGDNFKIIGLEELRGLSNEQKRFPIDEDYNKLTEIKFLSFENPEDEDDYSERWLTFQIKDIKQITFIDY